MHTLATVDDQLPDERHLLRAREGLESLKIHHFHLIKHVGLGSLLALARSAAVVLPGEDGLDSLGVVENACFSGVHRGPTRMEVDEHFGEVAHLKARRVVRHAPRAERPSLTTPPLLHSKSHFLSPLPVVHVVLG